MILVVKRVQKLLIVLVELISKATNDQIHFFLDGLISRATAIGEEQSNGTTSPKRPKCFNLHLCDKIPIIMKPIYVFFNSQQLDLI